MQCITFNNQLSFGDNIESKSIQSIDDMKWIVCSCSDFNK